MNQNIWGPHLWFSLHTISFQYPLKPKEEDVEQYKSFFIQLQHVIPCSICKKNYKRHLKEFPVDNHLKSRKDIVYWVIDLHNMVNSETGKRVISYEDAIKRYEDAYKKKIILDPEDAHKEAQMCEGDHCDQDIFLKVSNHTVYLLASVVILILILYVILQYYKVKIIFSKR